MWERVHGRVTTYANIQWTPTLDSHPDDQLLPLETADPNDGSALAVIPTWDGFRGARVSRFLYYNGTPAEDTGAQAPEPDIYEPFRINIPFKVLGRSRYLFSTAQDTDAPVVVEESTATLLTVRIPFRPFLRSRLLGTPASDESTVDPLDLPHWVAQPKYKPFGRNPYRFSSTQDESTVEPFDFPSIIRALQFKPLLRSPYRFTGSATDVETAAVEVETVSGQLIRIPFRSLLRNPYRFGSAQDFDAPVEADTTEQFLVRIPIKRFVWVRPGLLVSTAQDFDAPPPPVTTSEYTQIHHHHHQ